MKLINIKKININKNKMNNNLEVFTNDKLKNLKKITTIEYIVNLIYSNIIKYVKIKDDTTIFKYNITVRVRGPSECKDELKDLCTAPEYYTKFINENINEIINELKKLFPESLIYQKKVSYGYINNKLYDASELDKNMVSIMINKFELDCLIIDYS